MTERANDGILRVIIPILALADGVLHFMLDIVLFRGRFIGSAFAGGPRPGAVPRPGPAPSGPRLALPLPLNELFLLNFLGAVVLVGLFLVATRWRAARRWWIDAIMIGYAALTFTGWWLMGRPNPVGLGYLSKGIEIALVLALIAHISSLVSARRLVATTA